MIVEWIKDMALILDLSRKDPAQLREWQNEAS